MRSSWVWSIGNCCMRTIFDEFKSLEAVQASIDAAKTQLNEYQNLPPDFNDAKLKLNTMRAQIKRLDEEIENKFGVLD